MICHRIQHTVTLCTQSMGDYAKLEMLRVVTWKVTQEVSKVQGLSLGQQIILKAQQNVSGIYISPL